MNPWRRCAEAAVALVGDDHQRTGFGYQEVGPADAHVGVQELLAQHHPCDPRHLLDVLRIRHPQLVCKQLSHLPPRLVQRRGHQVRRRLVRKLDDVLAQVGFENVDSLGFQHVVEAKLLGHHRLALGNGLDVVGAGDLRNDRVGLLRVDGEVDPPAGRGHVPLQHLQVIVQVPDGVFLNPPRLLPPFLPHLRSNLFYRLASGSIEPRSGAAEGLAELRILHRRLGSGHKLSSNDFSHG